ncbi:hypothetical protein QFZ77_000203 [Paenibacillus sp. V4I3]|uniref:hypothetical protein n=1 Tax=unclassified Paenibacillus TaxID=185978 RepID=UPI00278718B3|nr:MULTISPECIES: hypothetical protein [unclassified Paenibacillus]MDQ0871544.1 hypothetical protein [Paenibacillus sp. V4I3]MDQ0885146.1 hypothetical protein [Paenibacillus sp. V4I9]
MEIKQMVESIVRELIDSLEKQAAKRPKVLYIFYDSTAHEAFTDHFIWLNNHQVNHDILFLDGEASSWLGKHQIECGGRGKTIASDEFAPSPLEVPLEYEGIVIPEIDLDNAARAALGMKGTIISEIIFSTLVQNKFVLIGDDISGLKRADRRTLRTLTLPKPYVNLFDYYKMELQMYGVEFGPLKQLAEMVVNKIRPDSEITEPDSSMKKDERTEDSGHIVYEGRLISADWVARESKSKSLRSLRVGKRTIISSLAQDMLKEKGITIEYVTAEG